MFKFFHAFGTGGSGQLPRPVLVKLVDLMLAGLAPVLTIGFMTSGIGLFISSRWS